MRDIDYIKDLSIIETTRITSVAVYRPESVAYTTADGRLVLVESTNP